MIAEALVLFACTDINGACDVTLQQYYKYNPEFKITVQTVEDKTEKFLGPELVRDATVVYVLVRQNTGIINMGHGVTLTANMSSSLLMWRKSW
jgi:hypothetical protein